MSHEIEKEIDETIADYISEGKDFVGSLIKSKTYRRFISGDREFKYSLRLDVEKTLKEAYKEDTVEKALEKLKAECEQLDWLEQLELKGVEKIKEEAFRGLLRRAIELSLYNNFFRNEVLEKREITSEEVELYQVF